MLNIDDLKQLKELRLQAGLTQKALAKKANTTQSTIAKIEAGTLTPSIKRAKQILEALKLAPLNKLQAKNIMTLEILSFQPSHPLKAAIKALTDNGFSQAPVIEGEKIIGKLTEAAIMSKSLEQDISGLNVSEIMEEGFPTVPPNANTDEVAFLLKFNQAILVISKAKLLGIITRADLIQTLIKESN